MCTGNYLCIPRGKRRKRRKTEVRQRGQTYMPLFSLPGMNSKARGGMVEIFDRYGRNLRTFGVGGVVVFPKHSLKEHVSLLAEPSTKPQSPWPGHWLSSAHGSGEIGKSRAAFPPCNALVVSSRPRNSQVVQKPRYGEGPGLGRGCHIASKNQLKQVATNPGTKSDHPLHSADQWESRR